MTARGWTGVLISIACALHVLACASQPGARPAVPGSVRLKVLVLPSLSSAPLFVAADGGHFAAQGLDVEFVRITRSTDALVALSRGDLDVWVGAVSLGLLNALARDPGIRVVSDRASFARAGCSYGALMVRRALVEASEIRRPADLRGRRIALNPASTQGYITDRVLGQAGLTLDDIIVADVPEGAVVADALRSGSVDAAFALEPWVTRNLQAGSAVVFVSAEQAVPDFQHMVAAFGPSLLARNPDAGRRFMAAFLAAVEQYNEGKTARNVEILARHTGLDEELVRAACWPSVRGDGRVDTASMLDFQDWGLKRRFLDLALTATRMWDSAFVDDANLARRRALLPGT